MESTFPCVWLGQGDGSAGEYTLSVVVLCKCYFPSLSTNATQFILKCEERF